MPYVSARYRKPPRRKRERFVDPTKLAKRRSAEDRRCPVCRRKSALRRRVDPNGILRWCRWEALGKCTYQRNFTPIDFVQVFEAAVL